MKRSNAAARSIFWLAIMFVTVFLMPAESGDRRTSAPHTKERAVRAAAHLDQNGQPAVNGVPSATSTIVDVMVGPGFCFRRARSTFRWATRCVGPGLIAATASPAAFLAWPIHNIAPLMIRIAPQEFFPMQARFIRIPLRSLALILISASRTALLA